MPDTTPDPAPEYSAMPPPMEPAYMREVRRLAQMHAQGILSTDEYEAKKRQVLGI